MPDNWRFSEEDPEQSLRDLGARIEYPPTPDLAHTVRRKLDEEERPRQARRPLRWPPSLAPRWTAAAAAVVLVAVVALSPALRTTLSGLSVSGPRAHSESAGSAAKPESGGSEGRHKQEAGAPSQAAEAPAAGKDEAATACPSPTIEALPARVAAGAKFRLRGRNLSSGCDGARPAHGVKIFFRQDGKTRKLATLDADRNLTFDARLHVPENAGEGRATLLAVTGSGERAKERFVVLR